MITTDSILVTLSIASIAIIDNVSIITVFTGLDLRIATYRGNWSAVGLNI